MTCEPSFASISMDHCSDMLHTNTTALTAHMLSHHDVESILSKSLPSSFPTTNYDGRASPSPIKHKRSVPNTPSSPSPVRNGRGTHKGPAVMQASMHMASAWIMGNYETQEGACIPRCGIYDAFVDYCADRSLIPMSAPIFGKIVHQVFPDVKTRRLGTRGQSKYHYDGLTQKDPSRLQPIDTASDSSSSDQKPKFSTPPPQSSSPLNFPLPRLEMLGNASLLQVVSLSTTMQATAQHVLNAAKTHNFFMVREAMQGFWGDGVKAFGDILGHENTVYLVCHYDDILYAALLRELGGNPLVSLSAVEIQGILDFANGFMGTVSDTCDTSIVPPHVIEARLRVAKFFVRSLKTQVSLNHCLQVVTDTLGNVEHMNVLTAEWQQLDWPMIALETKTLNCSTNSYSSSSLLVAQDSIGQLLHARSDLGGYIEWAMQYVLDMVAINKGRETEHVAQQCILEWSSFTAAVSRDLTLRSPTAFGAFHNIKVMIDEYIGYLFNSKLASERFGVLRDNALGTDMSPQTPEYD